MKKKSLLIFAVLILGLLSGCAPKNTSQTAKQMNVVICIECEDVYTLGMEYSVNGTMLGSQVCMSNPNASRPIKKGEKVHFAFTEFDFESAPDFGSGIFGFTLEVGLKDGEYIPLDAQWQWNAQYGEEYLFTLTNSDAGSFVLTAEDNGIAEQPLN